MKKSLTVTWITYLNFGTYLQAYALQRCIRRAGFHNKIADDRQIVRQMGRKSRLTSCVRGLAYRLYLLLSSYGNLSRKSARMYAAFRRDYLDIDSSFASLEELGRTYNVYIAGSDQIWSPSERVFHPYYYLSFTQRKKISYAASLGVSVCPEGYGTKAVPLLSSFSHLSVREEEGSRILRNLLPDGKEVTTVLDPTLLIERTDWEHLSAPESPLEGGYMACYMLTPNEKYLKQVRQAADREGKRLLVFATNRRLRPYADVFYPAGPREFLTAIRYADCVYTDSFHATIFSVLFRKEFFVFRRFSETDKVNQNSRIENLFRLLGIEGRFIGENKLNDGGSTVAAALDYEKITARLEEEREKSWHFLTHALND